MDSIPRVSRHAVRGVALALAVAGAVTTAPGTARASWTSPGLSISGDIGTPTDYSLAELADLDQVSVEGFGVGDTVPVEYTGPSLAALLTGDQAPAYPADLHNGVLRVTVDVTSATGEARTFALGELDSGFGQKTAVLALDREGEELAAPELVVGDDTDGARSLGAVTAVDVTINNPAKVTPPSAGAITVVGPERSATLTADDLAALPQLTWDINFLQGTNPKHYTEIGPDLAAVLRAAGFRPRLVAWVGAVASDDYIAMTTPGEATSGGRGLGLSLNEDGMALAQPRTLVDGDNKGGRYVSGVDNLVVTCQALEQCDSQVAGPAGPAGPAGRPARPGPRDRRASPARRDLPARTRRSPARPRARRSTAPSH